VSAVTDSAEAVQSGDAERGGEIAVGTAADGAFVELQVHLRGEGFCAAEEREAELPLERRAIEAAADFELGAGKNGAEGAKARFEEAHVGDPQGAKVEAGAGAVGDDVHAGAAFNDVGVERDAAAGIVPGTQAGDLQGEFVDSIDAFFGSQPRVRSAAANDHFDFADAFAGGFQQAVGTESGLEDKDGIAAPGVGLNQLARGIAADLLVGGPQEDDSLARQKAGALESFQSEESLDDSGFHVEDAGAESFAACDAERHGAESAGRVNGIVVAEDQELAGGMRFSGPGIDEDVRALEFLRNDGKGDIEAAPGCGDNSRAALGGGFFGAGRFGDGEAAEHGEHFREARLESFS